VLKPSHFRSKINFFSFDILIFLYFNISHLFALSNIYRNFAIIAKALGHPARVAILDYLVKVNTCICGDIVN